MKEYKKLLDAILSEAKEKHILKAKKGKATLPKPKPEKHNDTYHQKNPVQFKKPTETKTNKDGVPKAEPEQKKILDKNADQAGIAVDDGDLSEARKFRKLQEGLRKLLEDLNDAT